MRRQRQNLFLFFCEEMIRNGEYKKAKTDKEREDENKGAKRRKRVEEHELCKIPAGRGKWNGVEFRPMEQDYHKY